MKTEDYTKQQLHEAFSIEHYAHKETQDQLRLSLRNAAFMKYERNMYRDLWLKMHIKENVAAAGDMDEAIDCYFKHPLRKEFFTPSNGYYCIIDEGDHYFIMFAWGNVEAYKKEIRDMKQLIRDIAASSSKPIRYTGVNNVMRNHSIEIEPGLFELTL